MRHVYWEKPEIPIPPEASINTSDSRVTIEIEVDGRRRKRVIGYAATMTTMTPNNLYKKLFPDVWEEHYGKGELKPITVSAGMYALCLGASHHCGLYPSLHKVYGPLYANAIMDYAMFSIRERTDATQLFEPAMENCVLFSKQAYSDSWYSEFFSSKITDGMHDAFKIEWLKKCRDSGIDKVWLCIDGSNDDCEAKKSELPEFGVPKSHNTNKTIVGYIYAVSADDGTPVTYFVNEGSTVDCKAFQEMITFLDGYGMDVSGVILDRGFCTPDVIRILSEMEMAYVIMVPHDTKGFKTLLSKRQSKIWWKPEFLINGDGIFGITEEDVKIWGKHPDKAVMTLFFNCTSGSIQSRRLIKELWEAKESYESACSKGIHPKIAKLHEKYFNIEGNDNEGYRVSAEYGEWENSLMTKGFFSMITSGNFGAARTFEIYQKRDVSEKQYSILKSQEGYDVMRVHTTPSIRSKFAVCFAASILRHQIQSVCIRAGLDINDLLRKIKRLEFMCLEDGIYVPVRKHTAEQLAALEQVGINWDGITEIAEDYNRRNNNPINSQVHKMPYMAPVVKRKPGRPLGSKNKKTIAREAQEERLRAAGQLKEEPKKKAGRPAGSKDTKPRKKRSDAGIKRGPHKAR